MTFKKRVSFKRLKQHSGLKGVFKACPAQGSDTLRDFHIRSPKGEHINVLRKQLSKMEASSSSDSIGLTLSGATITPKLFRSIQELAQQYPQRFHVSYEGATFKGDFSGCSFKGLLLIHTDFRKASLKQADFTEATIKFSNFSQSDLQSSSFLKAKISECNFRRAHLQGASFQESELDNTSFFWTTLKQVTFAGAQLSRVDMRRATLTDLCLDDARTSDLDLYEAKLTRGSAKRAYFESLCMSAATITGTSFESSEFIHSSLRGSTSTDVSFAKASFQRGCYSDLETLSTDFSDAQFVRIQELRNAKFKDTQFRRATLNHCLLAGTTFNTCDLDHSSLTHTNFFRCTLTNTSFIRSHIEESAFRHLHKINNTPDRHAQLKKVTFEFPTSVFGIDFQQAALTESTFLGVTFNPSSTFEEATMDQLQFKSCDCRQVQGTPARFSLSLSLPSEWNVDTLDTLDHLRNGSSVLLDIHRLPSTLHDVKASCLQTIVESLDGIDARLLPVKALIEILSYYTDNEVINDFVTQKLCPAILLEPQVTLRSYSPHTLVNLLRYIATTEPFPTFPADTYYLLIAIAEGSNNTQLQSIAKQVEAKYLTHMVPDTLYNALAEDFDCDNLMIYCVGDTALITFKEDTFPTLLDPNHRFNVTRTCTFKKDSEAEWDYGEHTPNPLERLQASPLLHQIYCSQNMSAFRSELMETCFTPLTQALQQQGELDLSGAHTRIQELSEQAFQVDSLKAETDKIINPESVEYQYLMALKDMCTTLQSDTVHLTTDTVHRFEELFAMVGLTGEASGMGFLMLGIILTRLTSSYTWGTEGESPAPLRIIACACLKEAHMRGMLSNQGFHDIKQRLQGEGRAFTCSAVASNILVGKATDLFSRGEYGEFHQTAKAMLPLAWGLRV